MLGIIKKHQTIMTTTQNGKHCCATLQLNDLTTLLVSEHSSGVPYH